MALIKKSTTLDSRSKKQGSMLHLHQIFNIPHITFSSTTLEDPPRKTIERVVEVARACAHEDDTRRALQSETQTLRTNPWVGALEDTPPGPPRGAPQPRRGGSGRGSPGRGHCGSLAGELTACGSSISKDLVEVTASQSTLSGAETKLQARDGAHHCVHSQKKRTDIIAKCMSRPVGLMLSLCWTASVVERN
jgi:hypothetical protein